MWGNSLRVAKCTCTYQCMAVSYQVKHTLWTSNYRQKNIGLQIALNANVRSNQYPKTGDDLKFIHQQTDQSVPPHTGMLLSNERNELLVNTTWMNLKPCTQRNRQYYNDNRGWGKRGRTQPHTHFQINGNTLSIGWWSRGDKVQNLKELYRLYAKYIAKLHYCGNLQNFRLFSFPLYRRVFTGLQIYLFCDQITRVFLIQLDHVFKTHKNLVL